MTIERFKREKKNGQRVRASNGITKIPGEKGEMINMNWEASTPLKIGDQIILNGEMVLITGDTKSQETLQEGVLL
jgi:hypothetical protein